MIQPKTRDTNFSHLHINFIVSCRNHVRVFLTRASVTKPHPPPDGVKWTEFFPEVGGFAGGGSDSEKSDADMSEEEKPKKKKKSKKQQKHDRILKASRALDRGGAKPSKKDKSGGKKSKSGGKKDKSGGKKDKSKKSGKKSKKSGSASKKSGSASSKDTQPIVRSVEDLPGASYASKLFPTPASLSHLRPSQFPSPDCVWR